MWSSEFSASPSLTARLRSAPRLLRESEPRGYVVFPDATGAGGVETGKSVNLDQLEVLLRHSVTDARSRDGEAPGRRLLKPQARNDRERQAASQREAGQPS